MPAFFKIDLHATEEAHGTGRMKDRSSFIATNGGVRLYGIDKSEIRKECLKRDELTCTGCKTVRSEYNLDMHHIVPLGKGGSDTLDNVTTRCKYGNCHRKEHKQVRFNWSKHDSE